MRNATRLALSALVLGLAAAFATGGGAVAAAPSREPPNFVIVQTDDQALRELYATLVTASGSRVQVMPHTLNLIRNQGISFSRYYDSNPICAPSRSSLLSGRYAHHNGVLSDEPPDGGYDSFRRHAIYSHNLPVWLQRVGYRTIHLGKFLNHYGSDTPETTVPPGWDNWQTDATFDSSLLAYGYELNVDGNIEGPFGDADYDQTSGKDSHLCPDAEPPSGSCNYHTDELTKRAVGQIDNWSEAGPFYLQLDYNTPHGDIRPPLGPEPATRYYNSAAYTPVPKPPDFDEADVSDKPSFVRKNNPRFDRAALKRIRIGYQKILESLRSVDDGVKKIVDALSAQGVLGNTYIIFISDNGFFLGEHRLERAKFLPYEPAIHLPLLIRGPGIDPGSSTSQLASTIDLAPTIARLAGAHPDRSVDGESLIPYWTDTSRRSRRPLLLESFSRATDIENRRPHTSAGAGASIVAPVENYVGVRQGPYSYVEYQTGERELYDLSTDPYELHNQVRNPRYDNVQGFLKKQIIALEDCAGADCRITTGPIPEPKP